MENIMTTMYKSALGEVRSYEGWKEWARGFYTTLHSDDMLRDVSIVKHIDVMMPEDWWRRVSKVLKLTPVDDV